MAVSYGVIGGTSHGKERYSRRWICFLLTGTAIIFLFVVQLLGLFRVDYIQATFNYHTTTKKNYPLPVVWKRKQACLNQQGNRSKKTRSYQTVENYTGYPYSHIIFSTYKCTLPGVTCDASRFAAEENTKYAWRTMPSHVRFIDFTYDPVITKNPFGVPKVSSMYLRAQELYPDAESYTFVNADILPRSDIYETLDAVSAYSNKEFFIVGQRTNVPWNSDTCANDPNFDFQTEFQRGKLFRTDAEDYFVVSKNAIDWKSMPPFVIGRPGYDNWLVDYAFHKKNIQLFDATNTLHIIHQSDSDGDLAQGGKMVSGGKLDHDWNLRLGNNSYDHGKTNYALANTKRDFWGNVKVQLKQTKQKPEPFTIIVLTMNRVKSLQRLLDSINKTTFSKEDDVNLVINVDASSDNNATVKLAREFKFKQGTSTVNVAEKNKGLRQAWLDAWVPENENSRAIILEDDIVLAPLWYEWVKKGYAQHGNNRDLAGLSLQRQTLIPRKPHRQQEIVNGNQPFLYSLVGSIGFSPHPIRWKQFVKWIGSTDISKLDVSVPGLVTTDWWKALDKKGMWTQYFIYFCERFDLYTMYVNLPDKQTLAANMQEKGVHYSKTLGQDFRIFNGTADVFKFPDELSKYDWGGKGVQTSVQKNSQKNWLRKAKDIILAKRRQFSDMTAASSASLTDSDIFEMNAALDFKRMGQLEAYADILLQNKQSIRRVCQLNFGIGQLAFFWASIIPDIEIVAFDMCKDQVRCNNGVHQFEAVHKTALLRLFRGHVQNSISTFSKIHPESKCDLIAVSGQYLATLTPNEAKNLQSLSHPNTYVLTESNTLDPVQNFQLISCNTCDNLDSKCIFCLSKYNATVERAKSGS